MTRKNDKTPARFRNFKWLILPLLWSALIFAFSAQSILPGFEVDAADFVLKKVAHILIFAGQFWTWFCFFKKNDPDHLSRWWPVMLLLCLLGAIGDEWHQSFVPGRTATIRDVGFDMLGATLASLWSYRFL